MSTLPVATSRRDDVARALARSPLVGVVRTATRAEAEAQARALAAGGVELIEITFTVPEAPAVASELRRELGEGPPWVGMGTVTTAARARRALQADVDFIVTPNVAPEVAQAARAAGVFFILGALTPSEIVAAQELGADLVKVYPLPPVGGARYLATVRQPLGDVPMLAAGGFPPEEIPAYRAAGAAAFGIGAPLLGCGAADERQRLARALALARGEETVSAR